MRTFVGFVLLAAAAACGSGGGSSTSSGTVPLMAGFDPGPAPAADEGFQVILPIVDNIEGNNQYEYCTDTNIIMTEDTWVNASKSFQTETGHHVIFYYLTTPVAPSTHICTNDEMTEFQFGMPASGATASGGTGAPAFTLPGDLAVLIPKGAQVVVNHHYLNANAASVAHAQSAIDVYYANQSVPHTPSSTMVVLDTQLTVPTGSSTYGIDCTINKTYPAWFIMPHMHNWGTHITITDTPASTGVAQQLFDMDWTPDYEFDFTGIAKISDPSTPFLFNKGDKIHVQCDYLNNTGAEMTFGDEMCVMATFTVDPGSALGDVQCDRGVWGTF